MTSYNKMASIVNGHVHIINVEFANLLQRISYSGTL